jgi:hypothetical protein
MRTSLSKNTSPSPISSAGSILPPWSGMGGPRRERLPSRPSIRRRWRIRARRGLLLWIQPVSVCRCSLFQDRGQRLSQTRDGIAIAFTGWLFAAAADGLPAVVEDGMSRRSGSESTEPLAGRRVRSRTAKSSRISRHVAKSRCAGEWGGWGRLSEDGLGQHSPVSSEDPLGRRTTQLYRTEIGLLRRARSARSGVGIARRLREPSGPKTNVESGQQMHVVDQIRDPDR